ncbi:hypothetical protein Pmani_010576 [Petrolisthes manimaculis]|uniref:Methionine adenosyltransferase 2 subunit beta n=1 Tax=Petrolisthes manimaculis TaxID=1843537 RepID=A0AAE1Q1V0_9EUCA|nr:hypothetical protein Pmani_010576 [Petrolisthes manimaculis]
MSDKVPHILVTGASGLLGRAVVKVFKEKKFNVTGLAFSRVGPGLVKCDLTDHEAVTSLLEKVKPDVIIHSAAERFPDVVENKYEETRLLNIKTAAHIATVARRIGSRVIHISTDYVFDGTSPPYKPEDKCNPLNKYGITKWESEKAVLAEVTDACILRIPVLYGTVERLEESAVTTLLKTLKSDAPQSVSHHDQRCPAHVNDIAHILADMTALIWKGDKLQGIYQWSGRQKMTKYDMILTMSRVFSLTHAHLTPSHTPSTIRPYDPEMDVTRLTDLGISHHTNFEDGVKECLAVWV